MANSLIDVHFFQGILERINIPCHGPSSLGNKICDVSFKKMLTALEIVAELVPPKMTVSSQLREEVHMGFEGGIEDCINDLILFGLLRALLS